MQLSLSVRIAEEFLSKEHARVALPALAELAQDAGYDGLCMRASQVGIRDSAERQQAAADQIASSGLRVTMVTGDFDIVYNNDLGPNCLRNILPYLELARKLGAPIVRVALKSQDDIPWAQVAADEAQAYDLTLAHQCHTSSLFETVDDVVDTLQKIDRPNFGLIYEPANLEICGQDYGPRTIARLAPWIVNVYLQNQILRPDGDVTLETWCRGPVSLQLVPIHDPGGIDFRRVVEGLMAIDYDGPITAHQSGFADRPIADTARLTADYLKGLWHAR
ncbi:MAG: sugar phosphate isomerase/epimerase [Pirellulales bacterium]